MRSHSRKGEEQTGREHQSILRRRRIIFLLSYLVLSLLQCFFILYILYIFYTCFYYALLYFYFTFIIFPIMFLLSLCSSLIFLAFFFSFFPLATNSHAQSMSPVSCRSKRVDDHSRFYARPMETSSTVQACRRPQSFLRKSNGDVINRSDSIRYFVALLPQHVSEPQKTLTHTP